MFTYIPPHLHSYRCDVVMSETRDLYHRSCAEELRLEHPRAWAPAAGQLGAPGGSSRCNSLPKHHHTLRSTAHGTRACSRPRKSAKTGPAEKMPASRARQHPSTPEFTRTHKILLSYWCEFPPNRTAAPPIHDHASKIFVVLPPSSLQGVESISNADTQNFITGEAISLYNKAVCLSSRN